jgi:hypothetical protein
MPKSPQPTLTDQTGGRDTLTAVIAQIVTVATLLGCLHTSQMPSYKSEVHTVMYTYIFQKGRER